MLSAQFFFKNIAKTKNQEPMLPNLIIIGAMKSATSSLHHYLSLHPEVFMSHPKELFFFSNERKCRVAVGEYTKHFECDERVRGESSTTYTMFPKYGNVAERMYSLIPDAKLIYIVRDPIERLLSQYRYLLADGTENRSFDEALKDQKQEYIKFSQYHLQISQFFPFYPRNQIHVLTMESLRDRPAEVMAEVFSFLGLKNLNEMVFDERINVSEETNRKNWLGAFVTRRFRRVRYQYGVLETMPEWGHKVYTCLTRSRKHVDKVTLSENQRVIIADIIKEDADQFKLAFPSADYSSWSI